MTQKEWDFSQNEEDFPLGTWDDFDGTIINIEFQQSTFKDSKTGADRNSTQVHVFIKPAEYEYAAREIEYDEDSVEGIPQQWYGMGSAAYVISDDNMEILSGPNPQRSSRIVRFLRQMRESGFTPEGKSLVPFADKELHWKAEEVKNFNTGQMQAILWPVGGVVGRAMVAEESD